MDNGYIPSGGGMYLGSKVRGVRIYGGRSNNNARNGITISDEAEDIEIHNHETSGNGQDGIHISSNRQRGIEHISSMLDVDVTVVSRVVDSLDKNATVEEVGVIVNSGSLGDFIRNKGIDLLSLSANLLQIAIAATA